MSRWAAPTSSKKNTRKPLRLTGKPLTMDKENLDAMRGLAQNLANDNQIEAALDQYRTVQDADPQDADRRDAHGRDLSPHGQV